MSAQFWAPSLIIHTSEPTVSTHATVNAIYMLGTNRLLKASGITTTRVPALIHWRTLAPFLK